MHKSQINRIGANINATLWVPAYWRANSPTNMTQASNTSISANNIGSFNGKLTSIPLMLDKPNED